MKMMKAKNILHHRTVGWMRRSVMAMEILMKVMARPHIGIARNEYFWLWTYSSGVIMVGDVYICGNRNAKSTMARHCWDGQYSADRPPGIHCGRKGALLPTTTMNMT